MATPFKIIIDFRQAQELCGCGRIERKYLHLVNKPFLEVAQVINDVNINQLHLNLDCIIIIGCHSKCKILQIMALTIITISCLMSPLSA